MTSKNRQAKKRTSLTSVQRKPRVKALMFRAEESGLIASAILGKDGSLVMKKQDGSRFDHEPIKQAVGYVTANNKFKSLVSYSVSELKYSEPNRQLSTFGTVVAVDTNTIEEGGVRRSVTAIVAVDEFELHDKGVSGSIFPVAVGQFRSERFRGEEELVGWHIAFLIMGQVPDQIRYPVALISDKAEQHLGAMSAGKIPYLQEFFVPDGVFLIHATRDGGTREFAANMAIALADRLANEFMRNSSLPPPDEVYPGRKERGLDGMDLFVWGSEQVSRVLARMQVEGRSGLEGLPDVPPTS
ncbi:MAG: hypothetical protein QM674_05670 [Burkholderiaceae bacterium]